MSSTIEDEVGRSRIMEDGNESLLTMGLQHNNTSNHNNDMNIGNNKEVIPNANVMDRFTFTTDQPFWTFWVDIKKIYLWRWYLYYRLQECRPKHGDGLISLSASTDTPLKKWLLRKHVIKRKKRTTGPTQNDNINNNKVTHLDHSMQIKLRRQTIEKNNNQMENYWLKKNYKNTDTHICSDRINLRIQFVFTHVI